MELPKLVYDDFYKFLMSLGTLLIAASGVRFYFYNDKSFYLVLISGLLLMFWAGSRWYKNQKITDKILKKEAELKELSIARQKVELEQLKNTTQIVVSAGTKERVASVLCMIASVLPNSVEFNFLKDSKVWFLIQNNDERKYLAYVRIKFITDGFEQESTSDYYGGLKAWKLDAVSGIQAPGLGFPEKIKVAVKEGKRIKVEIQCEIHNEFDKFIEKKFPQTYVYEPQNNSWFLEP